MTYALTAAVIGGLTLAFLAGRYVEARRARRVLRGDIRPLNPFRHNPVEFCPRGGADE